MDQVIATFKTCNRKGDGLITYAGLAVLMKTVDPGFTEENFRVMMQDTGAQDNDQMKFEDFIWWLNGDKGAPAVIKAATSDDAGLAGAQKGAEEDDEEEEIEDEQDIDRLAEELDLEAVDLDLDQRVTRQEWIAITRKLDIDAAEANELFDDMTEDAVKEGLGDPETGFPLREFLEELKAELDDLELLKDLGKAAAAAKAELDKGPSEEPAADNPQVLNPALDRVVRELDKARRPADDAWNILEEGVVPLSRVQRAAIDTFAGRKDELIQKVKQFQASPPLVNAAAGQNSCRELCTAEVNRIVEKCKAAGERFTDPDWDLTKCPEAVLYVDKEKPGYDCTVGAPAAYKRLPEIVQDPVVFKGGTRPADIIQGQIGTCFLLGGLGAVVAKRPDAIRKMFIKYDVQTGVYGIRFCLDGEWSFVVVDDWMPVDAAGNLLFSRSKDPQEVWCSLLEKAFCKLHTCYEMCDGGFSSEAIFNFFGGVSGSIAIKDSHRSDPKSYFKLLKQAMGHGWLLTCHFSPKKGKLGGQGKCGEAAFDSGLIGGHVYSVLRAVEAAGNCLVCCRNPWGAYEWKGKWSDRNATGEWTDEMKQATGFTGINDGKFWMSVEDFVENAGLVSYSRPFGPNWKKITQYKHFQKGPMLATAKWAYTARASDELTIEKGGTVEVKALSAGWWYGNRTGDDEKKGYFPGNYVRLNHRPIARFDLTCTRSADVEKMTVAVLLMQPTSTRLRRYYRRKEDGLNYKDTSYSCIQLCIVSPEGKVEARKRSNKRELWSELKVPGGETWRIYAYSVDGIGSSFTLRAYVKDGTATVTEVPGADIQELQAAISKR